jgi:hypothetical protein
MERMEQKKFEKGRRNYGKDKKEDNKDGKSEYR